MEISKVRPCVERIVHCSAFSTTTGRTRLWAAVTTGVGGPSAPAMPGRNVPARSTPAIPWHFTRALPRVPDTRFYAPASVGGRVRERRPRGTAERAIRGPRAGRVESALFQQADVLAHSGQRRTRLDKLVDERCKAMEQILRE
jgi:hypothetical protein